MRTDIIKIAAKHYNTTPQHLKAKGRFAVYKALRVRGATYSDIGRWMLRDHSTIMYGVKQADKLMQDPVYRDLVERMINFRVAPYVEKSAGGLQPKGGLVPSHPRCED
jgi:chromosomal replication initiation ATPase DnaA